MSETKRLAELMESDLNRTVGVEIWQNIEKGKLTDFYGSFDDNNQAIVAVEIDENLTFFLPPNSTIVIY